jgi:hypothetical protein
LLLDLTGAGRGVLSGWNLGYLGIPKFSADIERVDQHLADPRVSRIRDVILLDPKNYISARSFGATLSGHWLPTSCPMASAGYFELRESCFRAGLIPVPIEAGIIFLRPNLLSNEVDANQR